MAWLRCFSVMHMNNLISLTREESSLKIPFNVKKDIALAQFFFVSMVNNKLFLKLVEGPNKTWQSHATQRSNLYNLCNYPNRAYKSNFPI